MKNALFLTLVLLCSSTLGCQERTYDTSEVLTEEKFQQLLLDIHLYKSRANLQPLIYDSIRKLEVQFTKAVLKKHNVPDSLYLRSQRYYGRHPIVLKELYTRVVDSLKNMEEIVRKSRR